MAKTNAAFHELGPAAVILATLMLGAMPAQGAGAAPEAPAPAPRATPIDPKTAAPSAPTAPAGPPPLSEAEVSARKYCASIAAAAADARFSWQSKKLLEVETRIKARIAELDAKQAEVKVWLDRRELIAEEAKKNLVGIYAKMKPEAAAAQIAALNDDMATAVLGALTPRQASAIFNEITPPDRAAKLAGMLASPAASADEKKL